MPPRLRASLPVSSKRLRLSVIDGQNQPKNHRPRWRSRRNRMRLAVPAPDSVANTKHGEKGNAWTFARPRRGALASSTPRWRSSVAPAHGCEVFQAPGNPALFREFIEARRTDAGLPAVQQDKLLDVSAHAVCEHAAPFASAAVFDHTPILRLGSGLYNRWHLASLTRLVRCFVSKTIPLGLFSAPERRPDCDVHGCLAR